MNDHIYLGLGKPHEARETLVALCIEENNRDDVKEIMNAMVDMIYNGEYSEGDDDTN